MHLITIILVYYKLIIECVSVKSLVFVSRAFHIHFFLIVSS